MKVTLRGDNVVAHSDQAEQIRFEASNVRPDRTGIHARVTIFDRQILLAFDVFNVERHGDRVKLANAAFKMLGTQEVIAQNVLKHEFDLFCEQIWSKYMALHEPTQLEGNPVESLPEFLAKPHVIKGGGALLFGPPGRGKSYTALFMGVCIDAGLNGFWDIEQAKVMYVNLERSANSIVRRLGVVNSALGLDPGRPLWVYNARGHSFNDVKDIIRDYVQKEGVELVILDSISRAGMGDLKENRPINAIADALNKVAPTWMALAHTPRGDNSHIYGSIFQEAAADIMIRLTAAQTPSELAIALDVTKCNDIQVPPSLCLAYKFDEYGVTDVRRANVSDFPDLQAQKERSFRDQIYEYLLEVGKANVVSISNAIGKSRQFVSPLVNSDERLGTQKDGRGIYYYVKTTEEPE